MLAGSLPSAVAGLAPVRDQDSPISDHSLVPAPSVQFGGSQSKPEFTVDLKGGSVEWASKDKSSKKHVIEVSPPKAGSRRLGGLFLTWMVPGAAEDPAGHRAPHPVGERRRGGRVVPGASRLHQHPRE